MLAGAGAVTSRTFFALTIDGVVSDGLELIQRTAMVLRFIAGG